MKSYRSINGRNKRGRLNHNLHCASLMRAFQCEDDWKILLLSQGRAAGIQCVLNADSSVISFWPIGRRDSIPNKSHFCIRPPIFHLNIELFPTCLLPRPVGRLVGFLKLVGVAVVQGKAHGKIVLVNRRNKDAVAWFDRK